LIRIILTPNAQTVSIDIPEDYIGKEIEVIAFAIDEGIIKDHSARKEVSFTALHVDTKDYKFNREEANER
jgi:hypothetical protein